MKTSGVRLGRQEKAKWGNLRDGIKCKVTDTYFLHKWVQDSEQ